jgi:hypothetical protein
MSTSVRTKYTLVRRRNQYMRFSVPVANQRQSVDVAIDVLTNLAIPS